MTALETVDSGGDLPLCCLRDGGDQKRGRVIEHMCSEDLAVATDGAPGSRASQVRFHRLCHRSQRADQ